jgi:hypothetical protein
MEMEQRAEAGYVHTFASMSARRVSHAESLSELRFAVEALLDGSPSEVGREILVDQLRFAHSEAVGTGLYESYDGEDPIIEATHEVIGNLLPMIDEQLQFETLYGRDEKEQKEVSAENLSWMAHHILSNRELPSDKISRWLGFIQGVLAMRGLLSVAAERDATRGIFHRAYSLLRIAKPVSASMGAVAGKVSDAAYRVLQLLRKDDRA